jgi:UDP-galactopyranose mutase
MYDRLNVDWLIAGAGLTGCTLAERIASQLDQTVLVVDRRNHIAGNAYDYVNEDGVWIHRYGPHVFHTNSRKVWDYLSQFTSWRPYTHRVLAAIKGKKVPIPFNLNSLHSLFPNGDAEKLEADLTAEFGHEARVPIFKLLAAPQRNLRGLADFVYENVYYGYTTKQWALTPEELDSSVTARVPIVLNRDDRFFPDTYQAMPEHGYTAMFERMLSHPNISVLLDADCRDVADCIRFDRMIYTGPIDEFFDYSYGPLPYRSLSFEHETLHEEWHQEVGTINYPNDFKFTRITEQKYLTGQKCNITTLVREYPQAHRPGQNEPYYPIPRGENGELYGHYADAAEKVKDTVIFAGRLADYKYYNMDQAAGRALSVFEKEIAKGARSRERPRRGARSWPAPTPI